MPSERKAFEIGANGENGRDDAGDKGRGDSKVEGGNERGRMAAGEQDGGWRISTGKVEPDIFS